MPMMRKTTSLRSIRKDHPVLTRLLSEDEDIIKIIRSFLTRLLSEDEDIIKIIRSFLTRLLSEDEDIVHGNI